MALPTFAHRFWAAWYKTICLGWAAVCLAFFAWEIGFSPAAVATKHMVCDDYIPFILMVSSLYFLSSRIRLDILAKPSPWVNTAVLGFGSVLAGLIGTTGAAVLTFHTLARLNKERWHKTHTFVFLIFLVGNVGGILSTLGDPPLLLGFLHGVPLLWPTLNLWKPFLCVFCPILLIYFCVEAWAYSKESVFFKTGAFTEHPSVSFEGWVPLLGLAGLIASFLLPAFLPNVGWILRDVFSLGIFIWAYRSAKDVSSEPIKELAFVFLCLMAASLLVFHLLEQRTVEPVASWIRTLSDSNNTPSPLRYFWIAGGLSSLLDNAPTFLVFFKLSGDNDPVLANRILTAISSGSVLMGALTYIGNAPNLLIRSLSEHEKIRMPSFFGFTALACLIFLPFFILYSVYIL